MWAVQLGAEDLVLALLEGGANINAKNVDGDTALHGACSVINLVLVSLLCKRGAVVNVRNKVPSLASLPCCHQLKRSRGATLPYTSPVWQREQLEEDMQQL
jgi:ankyrin repeat protein